MQVGSTQLAGVAGHSSVTAACVHEHGAVHECGCVTLCAYATANILKQGVVNI